MRQAAAQAYLDEPQPLHRSNGDEERYAEDLAVMRAAYLRKMLGRLRFDPQRASGPFTLFANIRHTEESKFHVRPMPAVSMLVKSAFGRSLKSVSPFTM
jgi:hypothetical protein